MRTRTEPEGPSFASTKPSMQPLSRVPCFHITLPEDSLLSLPQGHHTFPIPITLLLSASLTHFTPPPLQSPLAFTHSLHMGACSCSILRASWFLLPEAFLAISTHTNQAACSSWRRWIFVVAAIHYRPLLSGCQCFLSGMCAFISMMFMRSSTENTFSYFLLNSLDLT